MLISEKKIRNIIKENLLKSLLIEASKKDFKDVNLAIGNQLPLEIIQKKMDLILDEELQGLEDQEDDSRADAKKTNLNKMFSDVESWNKSNIAYYFSEPLLELFKYLKTNNELRDSRKVEIIGEFIQKLFFLYGKKEKNDIIDEEKQITAKQIVLFAKDKNTNPDLKEQFKNHNVLNRIEELFELVKNVYTQNIGGKSEYDDKSIILKYRKDIIDKETEYLFGRGVHEGYKIVMPTTTRSSVFWARTNWLGKEMVLPNQDDISWCTARYTGGNMFDSYFTSGGTNLFYFLPEGDVEGKRKFCIGITKQQSEGGVTVLSCGGHTTVGFENKPILTMDCNFNDNETRTILMKALSLKNPDVLEELSRKMKDKEPYSYLKYISGIDLDQFKSLVHIKKDEKGNATNSETVSEQLKAITSAYLSEEYKKSYKINKNIVNFIGKSVFPEKEKGVIDYGKSWMSSKNKINVPYDFIETFFPGKLDWKFRDKLEFEDVSTDIELYLKTHEFTDFNVYDTTEFATGFTRAQLMNFIKTYSNDSNDFFNVLKYCFKKIDSFLPLAMIRDYWRVSFEQYQNKDLFANFLVFVIEYHLFARGIDGLLDQPEKLFDFISPGKADYFYDISTVFKIIEESSYDKQTDISASDLLRSTIFLMSTFEQSEDSQDVIIQKLKENEKISIFILKYISKRPMEEKKIKVNKKIEHFLKNLAEENPDFPVDLKETMHYRRYLHLKEKENYVLFKHLFSQGIDAFDDRLEQIEENNEYKELKNGGIIIKLIVENILHKGLKKEEIDLIKIFMLRAKKDNKDIWKIFSILGNNDDNPFFFFKRSSEHKESYETVMKMLAYFFPDITKIPKEIIKNFPDMLEKIIHFHPEQKKNLGFIKRMFHKAKDTFSKEKEEREKESFEEKINRRNIIITEKQLREIIRKNLI